MIRSGKITDSQDPLNIPTIDVPIYNLRCAMHSSDFDKTTNKYLKFSCFEHL